MLVLIGRQQNREHEAKKRTGKLGFVLFWESGLTVSALRNLFHGLVRSTSSQFFGMACSKN